MQITDTIADMLTRIRNANSAKHASVDIPASNLKKQIAQILQDDTRAQVITGLRRVSKPGLRIYSNCKDMPKVMKGLGIAIVSTSKGIMTDKKARELNVGGEVLAFIW